MAGGVGWGGHRVGSVVSSMSAPSKISEKATVLKSSSWPTKMDALDVTKLIMDVMRLLTAFQVKGRSKMHLAVIDGRTNHNRVHNLDNSQN